MTETPAGYADEADDSVAEETMLAGPSVAEETMPADDTDEAELPGDYYVSLQPLTLDLIAKQLERIGIKFTRHPDYIGAGWESFTLTIRVLKGNLLSARATFREARPASSIAALIARCNWWNAKHTFLKASADVVTAQAAKKEDEGPATIPVARVQLDMDLPLEAGIAPVQLQSLFRDIPRNIESFRKTADLDALIPQSAWPWE